MKTTTCQIFIHYFSNCPEAKAQVYVNDYLACNNYCAPHTVTRRSYRITTGNFNVVVNAYADWKIKMGIVFCMPYLKKSFYCNFHYI